MTETTEATSTRPYMIRALYEWCNENGFTPYLAVSVVDGVRVPREFVKDGEIVLNISFDATSALKLGNEFIEFKGRFAGTARDIVVPVCQVTAIYARENGQGMAFPVGLLNQNKISTSILTQTSLLSVRDGIPSVSPVAKSVQLASVETESLDINSGDDPKPPSTAIHKRPALKRVK